MFENLPDDWDIVKVGELTAPSKHSCVGGPFGSNLVLKDYVEYPGVPVIRGGNLILGSRIFQDFDFVFVSEDKAASLRQNTAYPGDLVFMQRGASIGQVSLIPKNAKFSRYILSQNLMKLTPDEQKADVRFLCYYFLSPLAQELIQIHSVGSTIPGFNLTQLRDFPVPLPPLDKQKAIAHILGTLDDKIELNQQMNHTLEAIARAIFKSWFIDFDPVRAKMDKRQPAGMDAETAALFPAEFEDSPLGKIPKGWKIVQIQDIASRVAMEPFGSRITSDNFVSSGVPVIRGNNLVDGFVEDRFIYLTEKKADELKNSVAYPGDIVFTHRGTLGQVGLIPESAAFPRYVVSQSQMLLAINRELISPRIVYYFFRSPFGQQSLLANTNTTGVPSLARPSTSLKAIQMVIPIKAISDCFERIMNSLEEKREQNVREIASLTVIRDSLLQKLLSGQLRVV